jgi:uncharacterized damage-inducible protein DinB
MSFHEQFHRGEFIMDDFFASYLMELEWQHNDVKSALRGLPPPALAWEPGEEMNSIGVLVVHLTGAERYLVGDIAAGEPSGRNRSAEFQPQGLDMAALEARLDTSYNYIEGVLSRISLDDLSKPGFAPHHGETVSRGWALLHALAHTGVHLGQIEITRQLWEQEQK